MPCPGRGPIAGCFRAGGSCAGAGAGQTMACQWSAAGMRAADGERRLAAGAEHASAGMVVVAALERGCPPRGAGRFDRRRRFFQTSGIGDPCIPGGGGGMGTGARVG